MGEKSFDKSKSAGLRLRLEKVEELKGRAGWMWNVEPKPGEAEGERRKQQVWRFWGFFDRLEQLEEEELKRKVEHVRRMEVWMMGHKGGGRQGWKVLWNWLGGGYGREGMSGVLGEDRWLAGRLGVFGVGFG